MLNLEQQNHYTDWNVQSVFRRIDRNKYAYRVILYFQDGTKRIKMCSGFTTKREAENARKNTIAALAKGTYIANDNVKLKEFLDYWLEYDIRKRAQSANTYLTFARTVKNHIIPSLGDKKLTEINKGDIHRLYQDRAELSRHIARLVKTVMNVSFRYAVKCKLISVSPADGVPLPKAVESKPYHTRSIDIAKTLNIDQIQKLLDASKNTPIHMQVLFNVLMGLRRQEINGVKYSDVDYINRVLSVERQLGKELNRTPYSHEKTSAKSELCLKISSSQRKLPIPDIVFEAILEQRKIYERNREQKGAAFIDSDYICCSSYGKPCSTDFHWKYYKELLRSTGLPDIRWHDLRSTYCTMLLKQDFSPKAVSRLMGHARELITLDVYGDNANIIPEEIPELIAYMEEVLPEKPNRKSAENEIIDITVNTDGLLPPTRKSEPGGC